MQISMQVQEIEVSAEEKRIACTFRKEDIEEFYKLKKYGSIIRHPQMKKYLLTLVLLSIFFLISLSYSISENKLVVLTVMLFICLVGFLIIVISAWRPVSKWKKAINDFINKNMAIKTHALVLTDQYIESIEDDTRTLEKWSSISNIKIQGDYLWMKGSVNYLFNKTSMSEDDFEFLKTFALRKMKQSD